MGLDKHTQLTTVKLTYGVLTQHKLLQSPQPFESYDK